MSSSGKNILIRLKQRWQMRLWAEVILLAMATAIIIFFLFSNIIFSLVGFLLSGTFLAIEIKPWSLNLRGVSSYIDQHLNSVEYSTGLLLQPREGLSGLAQLQQEKVYLDLREGMNKVKPEDDLLKTVYIFSGIVLLGLFLHYTGITDNMLNPTTTPAENEIIVFKPVDSIPSSAPAPQLESQQAVIIYPDYTGMGSITTSNMNIKAVEGSTVTWKLGFDSRVDSVSMESMGSIYPMEISGDTYSHKAMLHSSGFYNFRFTDTQGSSYVSDLYGIEILRDQSPVISIEGLQPFVSFDHNENKLITFNAHISDDFGIGETLIIATVSKGTGESVKFREEKLNFDENYSVGSKNINLSKQINLDAMEMEPGDELYFYVQVADFKTPRPNISRSETFFAVIRDTASTGFGMESTLGVDLMPDYFRSQRQLIIDTEKLISQRGELSKNKFNAISNDLGFDQKSLRLKYGQFMGDEYEGALSQEGEMSGNNDEQGEDPLAEFTHDHDGDNEHNLVEHDHSGEEDEDESEESQKNPLEEFLHDHGDPESATLFTDSLKSKLRQVLDIMWDAELHLRLYEPEKSLPYQYQALALLQEIKNSARIYVHRIGYDPPPIKEDVRLTGKIDEVSSFQKSEELDKKDPYLNMRLAVSILEEILEKERNFTQQDRSVFELAANELSGLAIEEPGKYLSTLQQLKWLTEEKPAGVKDIREVQKGLLKALPPLESNAGKGEYTPDALNILLMEKLNGNDQ